MPFYVLADRTEREGSEIDQKNKYLTSREEHPMSVFKTRNTGSA